MEDTTEEDITKAEDIMDPVGEAADASIPISRNVTTIAVWIRSEEDSNDGAAG